MSDVRKIIDLDRLSRFKDDMDQEIAGQTPAISGNKLTIGSLSTPIAQDIVNVNDINGVPTTAYGSAAAARAAVDASSGLRIQGQIITYLLADGWYTDQYIGSATDSTSWGTASNWKTLGPVSVSQNTLTIGGEYKGEVSTTYDVTLHNSGATFASIEALLSDANLSTLIPTNVRKGGMSIKFVCSSDNKYVQFRLRVDSFSIKSEDWENVSYSQETSEKIYSINQNLVGYFNLPKFNGHLDGSLKLVSYGQAKYIVLKVNGGDTFSRVVYSDTHPFVILKDFVFNPTLPFDFAGLLAAGETGRRFSANELVLPNDAQYILIEYTNPSGAVVNFPTISINGINLVKSINDRALQFINVNFYNGKNTSYTDETTARNAISEKIRKNGLFVTYLLADGWHYDQFIGSDLNGWGTDSNWKSLDKLIKAIDNKTKISLKDDPVTLSSYIDGKYIKQNCELGTYSPAKVYYLPYNAGTKYKMRYNSTFPSESAYKTWAIYSTNDINSVGYSNKLAEGPQCATLTDGQELDIVSNDPNAKLLCITMDSNHTATLWPMIDIDVNTVVEQQMVEIAILRQEIQTIQKRVARYYVNNDEIKIAYPYGINTDIMFTLKKRGPNNLFDFTKISTIPHNSADISSATQTTIYDINTDMHCAYLVEAKQNADGDNKTGDIFNKYYTGGNHNYNNTGSGDYSATGRGVSLSFYADGLQITSGCGSANSIKMVWSNRIQAFNTTKVDGTGREVLQENHSMVFENGIFTDSVELIPLEDITMRRWYVFALCSNSYPICCFIGGTDRNVYTNQNNIPSGNGKTNGVKSYGTYGIQEMFVDISYDLGDRRFLNSEATIGALMNLGDAHKAYMNIAYMQDMGADEHYFVKGGWKYMSNLT